MSHSFPATKVNEVADMKDEDVHLRLDVDLPAEAPGKKEKIISKKNNFITNEPLLDSDNIENTI